MRTLLVIVSLFTFSLHNLLASMPAAQSVEPDICPNPQGVYYQPNLFPQFTGTNYRLVLSDWSTGEEVRALSDELPSDFDFSWSPDCHYLIAHSVGYKQCANSLIIWDATTGEQKVSKNGFCDTISGSYPGIFWRGDSQAVLLSGWYKGSNSEGSSDPRFIWYPATGQEIKLQVTGIQPNFAQVDWDDARGWLWGSSHYGVTAFDVNTGAQVVSFTNPVSYSEADLNGSTSSNFTFSQDGAYVIVHGQSRGEHSTNPALSVYHIASGIGVSVNPELNGAGVVALSPDNRYLVMGYTALRVWDLHNLDQNFEDRLPILRVDTDGDFIKGVRFVDGSTVEITTVDGTTRWDILTGKSVL